MTSEESSLAEIIGDLVEQWGFKRHLGRLWSLLYLRQEPLTPSQIQTELSLSAGNVNALLSELQTWGVVKRIRIAGDRNFYFEVQEHIWKSITNVLRAREMRILDEAVTGLKSLETKLQRAEKGSFQVKRIQHVIGVINTARTLGGLLMNASPKRLSSLSRLINRLRTM